MDGTLGLRCDINRALEEKKKQILFFFFDQKKKKKKFTVN